MENKARTITKIVIHCSDSDVGSHDNVATIESWHKARGFNKVGYHYVILKSGEVVKGRPLHEQGAHCKGHNSDSIGVCLTGRNTFTSKQFIALGMLCKELCINFNIKLSNIYPHNHYDSDKTCPNFELPSFDKTRS